MSYNIVINPNHFLLLLLAFCLKLETTATNSLPTNNNVSASSFSAKDISDIRNVFVQKQQALQPIKPIPSF